MVMKNRVEVSVGITVYNEEKNIPNIVSSLISQKTSLVNILEIIVVSSGSTDRTNELVKEFSDKDKKVKLLIQKTREGKASAINLFLKKMKGEIAVIESGDTIPREDTVEELCKPFLTNPKLGLTGARSIPTNDKNTFLGSIIHYWWWMHNELPRFGEMIAFRKELVPEVFEKTAVDEAYIEAMITDKGYEKLQIPSAVVNNHGAESLKDLIKQRKRVYIGHKLLIAEKNYHVQSFNVSRLLKLTARYLRKEKSVKTAVYIFGGILIEFYSRLLGMYGLKFKKENPYIWSFSLSTKTVNK